MKRLVIVESPTKARTIRKFLGSDGFRVEASNGHIRDLPARATEVPARLKQAPLVHYSIDVEHGFKPVYIVAKDKKKNVQQLKEALKGVDELYIATDEDREGEAIGWHLVEVLKPRVPVRRMVFHEITHNAILEALEQTREIDRHLVEAQETRRILDRLYGYSVTDLLWKKVKRGLSAGRVQSVAVRLLVQRERERILFVPASFWTLKAALDQEGVPFEAALTHVGGIRVAASKDFDDETGRLKAGLVDGKNVVLLQEAAARTLAERLPGMPWCVTKVEARDARRSPAPPFITSTLQQEASRKLGYPAKKTMRVAQRLYENGYITYMRTDSTNLSAEAIEASRRAVEERYGKDYLSPGPRQYTGKVRNAQEAHEAIRPAGNQMKTREELGLKGEDGALYDLIWKRTVATQMADARLRKVTVNLDAGGEATFRATGQTILFPGFFRAYVEGKDDPEAALEDRDNPLPPLRKDDTPACRNVEPLGRETRPPARFTDATLIKVMEKEGIGRPSTYASIIDTVIQRGYVLRKGNQLIPTFTAFAAVQLLERHFARLVDLGFTAEMEEALDRIAEGRLASTPYLQSFYLGEEGLEAQIRQGLDTIDARAISTISFPSWGPHPVRVGRFGPYVEKEVDGERITASLPKELLPCDVTADLLEETLANAGQKDDQVLGIHPEANQPVLLKKGPYGHYVQLGDDGTNKPRRASLPPGTEPEAIDLEKAVALLSLPRTLGVHPETGEPVLANIGKYGPYAQHGKTYASLEDGDDVLTLTLDRALALLSRKEARRKPLRVLGPHPETGEDVELWAGKYGPYVKHRRLNASLPKGREPETVTLEEALQLLEERARKKSGRRKKARS